MRGEEEEEKKHDDDNEYDDDNESASAKLPGELPLSGPKTTKEQSKGFQKNQLLPKELDDLQNQIDSMKMTQNALVRMLYESQQRERKYKQVYDKAVELKVVEPLEESHEDHATLHVWNHVGTALVKKKEKPRGGPCALPDFFSWFGLTE